MKKINLQKIKQKFIWKYKEEFYIDFNYLNEQLISGHIDYNSKKKDLYKYYLEEGFQFLNPNPCFDTKYFVKQLNLKKINIDKVIKKYGTYLNYFLNYGYKINLNTHEYFQHEYILKTMKLNKKINFWAEFQKNRKYFYFDTSEKFESFFYIQNYKDLRETNIHPLNHYLQYGRYENRLAKKNYLISGDDYKDFNFNHRVSPNLIQNIISEPILIKPKVKYIFNDSKFKVQKDVNYLKVIDKEKFFAFPYTFKIEVENRNLNYSPIEVLVDKLDITNLISKCRSILNGDKRAYPLIVKFRGVGTDDWEMNEKLRYISFLISYLSLKAVPIFFEGNKNFFNSLSIHSKLNKIIDLNAKSKDTFNFLDYYKYGHELRQIALDNLCGNLFYLNSEKPNIFNLKLDRIKLPTISVVTVTNRLNNLLDHTIDQILKQSISNFEWIIVTQGILSEKIKSQILSRTREQGIETSIFEVPSEVPLGTSLNVGIKNCSGEIVAKFDDDDYYLPNYLRNSVNELIANRADLVGKWMEFTYFQGQQSIYYDNGPTARYMETEHITGSSLVFKRSLFFDNFAFYDISKGEDVCFRNSLFEQGKKVFRIHGFDHIVFRSSKKTNHTWQITDDYLIQEMIARSNTIGEIKLADAIKFLDLNTKY